MFIKVGGGNKIVDNLSIRRLKVALAGLQNIPYRGKNALGSGSGFRNRQDIHKSVKIPNLNYALMFKLKSKAVVDPEFPRRKYPTPKGKGEYPPIIWPIFPKKMHVKEAFGGQWDARHCAPPSPPDPLMQLVCHLAKPAHSVNVFQWTMTLQGVESFAPVHAELLN